MIVGAPKRVTQFRRKAEAQVLACISGKGTASGHLVNLSMMVSKYENPSSVGSGPTMST